MPTPWPAGPRGAEEVASAARPGPPKGREKDLRGVLERLDGRCSLEAAHAEGVPRARAQRTRSSGTVIECHRVDEETSSAGAQFLVAIPEGQQTQTPQRDNLVMSQSSTTSKPSPVWRSTRLWSTLYGTFDEELLDRRALGPVQLNVWKFMSNPESSFTAGLYNRLNSTFILVVVLLNMIQCTSLQILSPDTYMGIECSIEALFLLEISAIFAVCPYRRYFLLRFYNIIDILSVLPLALRVYKISMGGCSEICTVIFEGFVPVVRLLKAMRHFQTSRLLANAFILAKEAVPVLVFYYAVLWLLFTAIIYAVEARPNIPSLPDAMWLTVVTMTTVGYGDVIPVTGAGRMAVSVLVLASTLYMAIPLGINGSCFSAVWDDRDKILLFERLRTCFMEAGCSDLDVPCLFSRFDKTNMGSLDALEFIRMCTSLKLGLSEERLMMLFNFWASGEDGRIAATTFQHVLFPKDCLKMLEKQAQEQANALRRMAGPSNQSKP